MSYLEREQQQIDEDFAMVRPCANCACDPLCEVEEKAEAPCAN